MTNEVGAGIKHQIGGERLGSDALLDTQEMCKGRGRLQPVFCCSLGMNLGVLDLKRREL